MIGRLPFEVELEELDAGDELRRDGYAVAAFAVDHGVPALGYALVEDERPGPLRRGPRARARRGARPRLRAPAARRGGGRRDARTRCWARRARGRRVVITGDTRPVRDDRGGGAAGRPAGARGHVLPTRTPSARSETGHSTAGGAARLAAEAEVKLLALTHISSRYPVSALQDEARGRVREHDRPARLRPRRAAVPGTRGTGARARRRALTSDAEATSLLASLAAVPLTRSREARKEHSA